MFARYPVSLGTLGALLLLVPQFVLSEQQSVLFAAIMMGVIAGAYLGFAAADGRSRILGTELVAAIGFAVASFAGALAWPLTIPVVIIDHGFWDVAHHALIDTRMPRWWIPFCAVFDWVFGFGLIAIWMWL